MSTMLECVVLTATKAEAAPLINYFGLVKTKLLCGYSTYQNASFTLIVTGIGYEAALNAVKELLTYPRLSAKLHVINVGIAGAKGLSVGALVWPQHYNGELINNALPANITQRYKQLALVSNNTVTTEYQQGEIVDMEFAGIFDAMHSMKQNYRLFCAKVISDNEAYAVSKITPQGASDLIRLHLNQFALLIGST